MSLSKGLSMSPLESRPGESETLVRSTERIPVRARKAYWNDTVSVLFPHLAVDWLTNEPVQARLKIRPFADARVIEVVDSTPGHVTYTSSPSSSPSSYLLVLQLAGNEHYVHAGREVIQEPGDLVLLDTAQSFDATFPRGHQILVWHLPRAALAPLLASPERAVAARISGHDGLGAVLAGYAGSLASEVGRLDRVTGQSLQLHLCSLAGLALGGSRAVGDARYVSCRAARRQQILTYIENHLGDGSLTAERAARDLKMSRRWLHALLEESETSFAAHVARRRVEECRKLLDDPRCDHFSVTEIALRSGFNDLSTFNRRFRSHCGMTPRDVRHGRIPPGAMK